MLLSEPLQQLTQRSNTSNDLGFDPSGGSLFFLVVCCCLLFLLPFITTIIIGYVSKLSQASSKGKYVPDKLSQIWFRTFLINTKGVGMIFISIFVISLSFISIDFSAASTAGIFLLVVLILLWIYAQLINLFLFYKQKVLGQELIKNNIKVKAITEGEAIKANISLQVPFPIGFILKMTLILPPELGGEIRTSNAVSRDGFVNFQTTLPKSRRGQHEVGPIIIEYQDIFGFNSIKLFSFKKSKLTIYPKVRRLRKLSWESASKKYGEEFKVKQIINSDDYFNIREYRRGDDMRKIHWKTTAKTDKLMIRIPEVTYVTTGNFLLLIDNLIPGSVKTQTLSKRFEGTMNILDRILEISGSIIDFTLKNDNEMKVIYHYGYNKVKKKEYIKSRREEWLEHLSSIKWHRKTSKSKYKIFDLIVKEAESVAGVFIVTSEMDPQRFDYLKSIKGDMVVNIIYIDPYTFFKKAKNKKNLLKKFGSVLISDPYLEKYPYFDNLLYSKLKSQNPDEKFIEKVRKYSKIMHTNLNTSFRSVKYVDKSADYIHVLEKE